MANTGAMAADYANRKVDLSLRTANQYQSILASAQNSFDAGLNRGMASYNYHAADRIASTKAFTAQSRLNSQMNQQRYYQLQQVESFGDMALNFADSIATAGFIAGDFLTTAAVDIVTLRSDPGAIFNLEARTDKVISQGYLPKGQELSYRMANEIYDRGLNDFTLRVDGRELTPIGSMVSPLPFIGSVPIPFPSDIDNLKVHGSVGSRNGRIFDGNYDFIDDTTKTLNQYIDPNLGLIDKAIIYSRNKLNNIAYSQHSALGKPYHIEYTYNDNDLRYGRNNFAPWKPDIDPSYAAPYASYLRANP